jgi:hypothetical protein
MLLAAARLCRNAYEMDFLVSCLLESSLLRNVTKLGEAVERAISIATRDPVIRDHLLHEVRKYHAIPSATTIRRHHLTLHMIAWRSRSRWLRLKKARALLLGER